MHVHSVVSPTLRTLVCTRREDIISFAFVPPVAFLSGTLIFFSLPNPQRRPPHPPRDIQVPREAVYDQQAKMMEAWIHDDYYLAAGDNNSCDDVLESGGGSATGGPSSSSTATASAMRVCLCVVVYIPLLRMHSPESAK